MKKFFKRVYGDGVILREWLTLDEQVDYEAKRGNLGGYYQIALQRQSYAQFWVSGAVSSIILFLLILGNWLLGLIF